MELYKEIKEYKGYYVSNLGNIKSKKLLKPTLNKQRGYFYVKIRNKNLLLHRLVAKTFLNNPEKKEEVNHIDGNKGNNKLSNLEWVTRSENHLHAVKLGLRSRPVGNKKYSDDIIKKIKKKREEGLMLKDISTYFNIPISTITHICLGTRR